MGTHEFLQNAQKLVAENENLKELLHQKELSCVDSQKFYAVALSVDTVAALHNVHPDTVRKYLNLDLIEKHPDSSTGKFFIRASVALTLNFLDLQRRARKLIYSKPK